MNTIIDAEFNRIQAVNFLKECDCNLKYAKRFREFRTYIHQIRFLTNLPTQQILHDVLKDSRI